MKLKINAGLGIIFLALAAAYAMSSPMVYTGKTDYLANEPVAIIFEGNSSEEIGLSIYSGSEEYTFLGEIGNTTVFIPSLTGLYHARIVNRTGGITLSEANFSVGRNYPNGSFVNSSCNSALLTGKSDYSLGESVVITFDKMLAPGCRITISSATDSYEFLGDAEEAVQFVPREPGAYEITMHGNDDRAVSNKTIHVASLAAEAEGNYQIESVSTDRKIYSLGENAVVLFENLGNYSYEAKVTSAVYNYTLFWSGEKNATFSAIEPGEYNVSLLRDGIFAAGDYFIVKSRKEVYTGIPKIDRALLNERLFAPKRSFRAEENAEFDFDFSDLANSSGNDAGFRKAVAKRQSDRWVSGEHTISARVLDDKGKAWRIPVQIEEDFDNSFSIIIEKGREFRPGLYFFEINFSRSGEDTIIRQNFTWGVLAINTNKPAYLEGETAQIGIAVLDSEGSMVCNASVLLEITDAIGERTTLSTKNGISVTEGCYIYDVTKRPDYYTNYTANSPGTYMMNLTAITASGTWNIADNFTVEDKLDFDIERLGHTRIYPYVDYTMRINIKPNRDYRGLINEYVPASFAITPEYGMVITAIGDTKAITWDADLKRGEAISLEYEYNPPDISPEFYLAGRLSIGDWREQRHWQIASDAQRITAIAMSTAPVNGNMNILSGQTFSMTCTPTCSGSGGITLSNYYQYSTTACGTGDANIPLSGAGGAVLTVATNPDTVTTCSATSETVTAVNPGSWLISCYATDGSNTRRSSQCYRINVTVPDRTANLTINGNRNSDKIIAYPTPANVNATCGLNSTVCYLFGNTSGAGQALLASDSTYPFFAEFKQALAAGYYNFTANSTFNASGRSNTLRVDKDNASVFCYVNSSLADFGPRIFPIYANVTAKLYKPAPGIVNISIEDIGNFTGSANLTILTTIDKEGAFLVNCSSMETQNYTWSNQTSIILSIDRPPYYANAGVNDSLVYQGESANVSTMWFDNYRLNVSIFSSNESGIWANTTPYGFISNPEKAMNTTFYSHAPGTVIGWVFYANDSNGYTNMSGANTIRVLGAKFNDSSYHDFGKIEANTAQNLTRKVISYGLNSNVRIDCHGDCTTLKSNWTTKSMNEQEMEVKFNCSSGAFGEYYANFTLHSDEDFIDQNISIRCEVQDLRPPYWSNNMTGPAQPRNYSDSQEYQFNITWIDNIKVANATIEHNFTGILKNYTIETKDGDVYYYNAGTLAAGTWGWRFYANDSAGNLNFTEQWTYLVYKANSSINLTLNSTESDIYLGEGDFVNITAFLKYPGQGTIEVYLDGIPIYTGQPNWSQVRQFTSGGNYNITARFPETVNYTGSSDTLFAYVKDIINPWARLDLPLNGSFVSQANVSFCYTPYDNVELRNATLWGNFSGTWAANQSNQTILISGQGSCINASSIIEGRYVWSIQVFDSSNNSAFNSTNLTLTIDRTAPSRANISWPKNNTKSLNQSPMLNWTQSFDYNFRNYSIDVDNDINFGSINYRYSTNASTNTTVYVSGTWDNGNIWYIRLTAWDKAGNMNISDVFYYTVDTESPVLEILTKNNTYSNSLENYFSYIVTDFTNVTNCSLIINNEASEVNRSIEKGVMQQFKHTFSSEGGYNWSVNCTDEAGNRNASGSMLIVIDMTEPAEFNLSYPSNGTISTNRMPRLNWTNSSDSNFNNYTLQIDDSEDFSLPIYQYYTFNQSSLNYTIATQLSEGPWYWRVTAYDKAGNSRNSSGYFRYIVDATGPAAFELDMPLNNTASRNNTPTLNWTESSDTNFAYYTFYVSSEPDFRYINYSNSTPMFSSTNNSYRVNVSWQTNTRWYWYVAAYDLAGNSTNSSEIYEYSADVNNPQINLSYPSNNSESLSCVVDFGFNVSDLSDIRNCSLVINGVAAKTETVIRKDTIQIISETFMNGYYNWSINCTDGAMNTNSSETRLILINSTLPMYRFYETYPGTAAFTDSPPSVNLSLAMEQSGINTITRNNVPYTPSSNFNNATTLPMSSYSAYGFLIPASSTVTFSNYITLDNPGGYGTVTWVLYKVNSTGEHMICSRAGVALSAKSYQAYIGSCTTPNYQVIALPGDRLKVNTNVTGASGSNKLISKQIDVADTFVDIHGYMLGNLTVALVKPTVDPRPGEGELFNLSCKTNCSKGYCLETKAYSQFNTSEAGWKDISTTATDNIILNSTQPNPIVLGILNATEYGNFSLIGNIASENNSIRCFAWSKYSNYTSINRTVTVIDKVSPNVTLISPSDFYISDPANLTFGYLPLDNHLNNCSLYGNFSGTWKINQTNESAELVNGGVNYFSPVPVTYGLYSWNVKCTDTSGNSNFSSKNWTFTIAGDISLNSTHIAFSISNPVENDILNVTASVFNSALKEEPDTLIRFYEATPNGLVQMGGDIIRDIPAKSNITVNVSWVVKPGNHTFVVAADPENVIIESNEANNRANKSIFVSSYHVFYGSSDTSIVLDSGLNFSVFIWKNSTDAVGNIYAADTDTKNSIDWSNLFALGRDALNNNAGPEIINDWEELDSMLNMTNMTDSINSTYLKTNYEPADMAGFTINGIPTSYVSIVNSTNTSDFVTGILWDRTDSEINNYFDSEEKEDIVFATSINTGKTGMLGTYDYEIKVPAGLRKYQSPNSGNTLTFYVEVA